MGFSRLTQLIHPIAESFWRQAALNTVSPIVAALLGGLVVGLIVQYAQNRRTTFSLRTTLSFEVMQVAYACYYRVEEAIRRERYGQEWNANDLHQDYEEFRIAARVLEAKLHAYFKDGIARWLWHDVVDLLTVRYYGLVHKGQRFEDLVARHGKHPHELEIPVLARSYFLNIDDLRDDQKVRNQFEIVLNDTVMLILPRNFGSTGGGPPILSAGVEPRLATLQTSEASEGNN